MLFASIKPEEFAQSKINNSYLEDLDG